MTTLSNNPLAKHFRQPALHLRLPSQGKWWKMGSLELPVTGEIPIYPMTARDEITMKTPDALLNGSSTAHVIESCCPSIKNAWDMPVSDLDTLLIAIRIATYGNEMDFTAVCPHCGEQNEHAIDLTVMLSNIGLLNWEEPIKVNGLAITLKPMSYEEYNKNSLGNFNEQRLIQLSQDETLSDEEKTQRFNSLFNQLIESGIEQMSFNIHSITTEDGTTVSDRAFIKEFLDNCEKSIWEAIKAKLDGLRDSNKYNELNLTCSNNECSKEFKAPFLFEQSNFFG